MPILFHDNPRRLSPSLVVPLLAAAVVAAASSMLPGCGRDSHAAPPHGKSAPAAPSMLITPPSPDTLEGQHGGFFSVGLPAKSEYVGAESLAATHPLYAPFQTEAKAARARLSWQGKPLEDFLRADAKAARLWTEAMRAPVVGDSRQDAKGDWLVVVRADILPLTRHLRTRE